MEKNTIEIQPIDASTPQITFDGLTYDKICWNNMILENGETIESVQYDTLVYTTEKSLKDSVLRLFLSIN